MSDTDRELFPYVPQPGGKALDRWEMVRGHLAYLTISGQGPVAQLAKVALRDDRWNGYTAKGIVCRSVGLAEGKLLLARRVRKEARDAL